MPVINPKTGKEFRWANNPKPTTMARWHKKTMYGGEVKGTIRHIAHLDRMNNLAKARYGEEVVVIQSAWNTTIRASAGTHDKDMTADLMIPNVSWWEQQRFFRRNGFGCWYRQTTPGLWSNHIHGFTLPHVVGTNVSDDWFAHGYKVGIYVDGGISVNGRTMTSSQIQDYYNHAFGLKDQHAKGSDHSWFPPSIEATIFDYGAYRKRHAALQAAA